MDFGEDWRIKRVAFAVGLEDDKGGFWRGSEDQKAGFCLDFEAKTSCF